MRPPTTEDDVAEVVRRLVAEKHIHATGDVVRFVYVRDADPGLDSGRGWFDRAPLHALLYAAVKEYAVLGGLLREATEEAEQARAELARLRDALRVVGAALSPPVQEVTQ